MLIFDLKIFGRRYFSQISTILLVTEPNKCTFEYDGDLRGQQALVSRMKWKKLVILKYVWSLTFVYFILKLKKTKLSDIEASLFDQKEELEFRHLSKQPTELSCDKI